MYMTKIPINLHLIFQNGILHTASSDRDECQKLSICKKGSVFFIYTIDILSRLEFKISVYSKHVYKNTRWEPVLTNRTFWKCVFVSVKYIKIYSAYGGKNIYINFAGVGVYNESTTF